MKIFFKQKSRNQRGAVLIIILLVLISLTAIGFLAANVGKTDIRISTAYASKSKAFLKGEEVRSRLRYALEQVPLPTGIAAADGEEATGDRPIWTTANLAAARERKDGEPDFTDPDFAGDSNRGWVRSKTLTCQQIADWMKNPNQGGLNKAVVGGRFQPLDCQQIDPDGIGRIVIDLITTRQNEGDIDDLHNTYYYRLTIYTEGDPKPDNLSEQDDYPTGRSLVQSVTGIQYN